jgi:hypothetical protein
MQASFAPTFQKAAIVPRAALYGTDSDPQLPASLLADARVPFLGYCGPRYSVGNPILLAINPGGGSDDYSERHAEDEELIPLIEAFVHAQGSATPKAFEKMCHVYMEHVQTWNLRNIVTPTLAACGKGVDEVCYLNVFPYRTRKNAMPSAKALTAAWEKIVAPLLGELRPRHLIALGKKAGGVAERFRPEAKLFIVQRTNGDRYVCDEAKKVLETLRGAT